MKFLVILGMIGLTSLSHANQNNEVMSVKVYGGACGGDVQKWRGSGVLFKDAGADYVLTSNHVLLNGNGSYCHQVENSKIGAQEATLVASDWGIGLALLKLTHKIAGTELLERKQLFSRNLLPHELVSPIAYPYGATAEPLSSSHGEVVSTKSDRHFFANSFLMTELAGAHVEYGMSGGPVFGSAGQFGGILSHQAIMRVSEGVSRIVDFSVATEAQSIYSQVFVIPTSIVRNWVNLVLTKKDFIPSLSESPELQIAGTKKVFSDGLEFSIISSKELGSGVGGGHGTGVGGSDEGGGHGSGIGGSDEGGGHGVGVGGNSDLSAELPSAQWVEVKLNLTPQFDGNFFESHQLSEWVKVLKHSLELGRRVVIPMMLKAEGQTLINVTFDSLDEFFRMMATANMHPVTELLPSKDQKALGDSDTPTGVSELAQGIQKEIQTLSLIANGVDEKVLLKKLNIKMALLKSIDWQTVQINELKSLSDGYGLEQPIWHALLSDSRNDTIELMQKLNQLCSELTRYLK